MIKKRNRLDANNVTNLMTINLIGLCLNLWNCTVPVKNWLKKNHSDDDKRVKKSLELAYNSNELAMWKFLGYSFK